jgi:hypothetical protein
MGHIYAYNTPDRNFPENITTLGSMQLIGYKVLNWIQLVKDTAEMSASVYTGMAFECHDTANLLSS